MVERIETLKTPKDYFETVKDACFRAKDSITLSALYVGTGSLEKSLIDVINSCLKKNPALRVTWLLDYMRGTRGDFNSVSLLAPLIKDFGDRVKVYLFRTPCYLCHLLPQRWNETIGLLHIKLVVADRTLIISGANLSHDYFTNRQDRYLTIYNTRSALLTSVHEIVNAVLKASFLVNTDGSFTKLFTSLLHVVLRHTENRGFEGKYATKKSFQSLPSLKQAFLEYHNIFYAPVDRNGTEIYPFLQAKQYGIVQDQENTRKLFQHAPKDGRIYLAVGYFNPTDEYIDSLIHKCQSDVKILTSCPKANGFYGASGVSRHLPSSYTYLLTSFLGRVNRELSDSQNSSEKRIKVYEYDRPDWTFHAKGLWYYPPGSELPTLSLVGSPNFGYRSVVRDLELQFLIRTSDVGIRQQLHAERLALFSPAYSHAVTLKSILADHSRRVPCWVRFATRLIRTFL